MSVTEIESVYVHVQACLHVYAYAHIYIHTHTRARAQTHTHTVNVHCITATDVLSFDSYEIRITVLYETHVNGIFVSKHFRVYHFFLSGNIIYQIHSDSVKSRRLNECD
jgi:hypothetical protein